MVTVRRIRPESEISRSLGYIAVWRYGIASLCYVVLILLATITLVLLLIALTTESPAFHKISEHVWPLTGLFVSGGGIGALLIKSANREHRNALLHRVLDEIYRRPPSETSDAMIRDISPPNSSKASGRLFSGLTHLFPSPYTES
jgi:hypothetical protein